MDYVWLQSASKILIKLKMVGLIIFYYTNIHNTILTKCLEKNIFLLVNEIRLEYNLQIFTYL